MSVNQLNGIYLVICEPIRLILLPVHNNIDASNLEGTKDSNFNLHFMVIFIGLKINVHHKYKTLNTIKQLQIGLEITLFPKLENFKCISIIKILL